MWALMDHNPQLIEDFTHANLDAPGLPSPASSASAGPAVMVRPPSVLPSPLESATKASGGLQSILKGLGWELGMPCPGSQSAACAFVQPIRPATLCECLCMFPAMCALPDLLAHAQLRVSRSCVLHMCSSVASPISMSLALSSTTPRVMATCECW